MVMAAGLTRLQVKLSWEDLNSVIQIINVKFIFEKNRHIFSIILMIEKKSMKRDDWKVKHTSSNLFTWRRNQICCFSSVMEAQMKDALLREVSDQKTLL